MIWLTWRQFRTQALMLLGALAAVATALAITRPGVADLRDAAGDQFPQAFAADSVYPGLYYVAAAAVYALPALVGMFWGAPLVARELEGGTHRLIWNQSITRTRWLATKIGVAVVVIVVAGLLSLAASWWTAPLDAAINSGAEDSGFFSITRLSGLLFGARGLVPIGFAMVAFGFGVTAGLLLKRTVPAMAATLIATIAMQVAVPLLVQPLLLPTEEKTVEITADNMRGMRVSPDTDEILSIGVRLDDPGAWIVTNEIVDSTGQVATPLPLPKSCSPGESSTAKVGPPESCADAINDAGYRHHVVFQPADRYWLLQWIETGLLVVVAGALLSFCFWRIRRDPV